MYMLISIKLAMQQRFNLHQRHPRQACHRLVIVAAAGALEKKLRPRLATQNRILQERFGRWRQEGKSRYPPALIVICSNLHSFRTQRAPTQAGFQRLQSQP